ncbi:DUF4145 domain-containing protein [Sphingobium sp. AS12]|uniref:DUF4145 domain-containing protein n=1 Tax=Sphingobium sp. AS12 TaxID=2849495 RepID=UPI0020C8AB64|nr:DUF4145 domain-containing protein [Sphingobium sp. AS12]
MTLSVSVKTAAFDGYGQYNKVVGDPIYFWNLLPENNAKPQPAYIPEPIVEDYVEACRIRNLSPKASATLSRRCLQGMIRDFCGISKARLIDEINELKRRVDEGKAAPGVNFEAVEAIDQVRGIGNIGAHMEKDINLIIPVDADEAQLLIQLIEMLFEEWYVARHSRQQRLARIASVSDEKKAAIANARAGQNALAPPTVNPSENAPE